MAHRMDWKMRMSAADQAMWTRREWREYFERTNRRWDRYRPLRPVAVEGGGRVHPAAGFSVSELDEAGISLEQAQVLDLPVDVGRVYAYGPNVAALRDFIRVSRDRD